MPNMFLHFSALIFPLLFVSVCSASYSGFIKLAYGVSQAAYLPKSQPLVNGYGQIMRSERYYACRVGGWQATRWTFGTTDETVVIYWHYARRLAVIGFRGTDSYTDWKHNLKINMVRVRKNYAVFGLHDGFFERYRHIRSWFKSQYGQLRRMNYKIIFTGHSLGGAMATISAALVAGNLFLPPDAVITFASPKVGNSAFRNFYEREVGCAKTTRIEVRCDLITKLPLSSYVRVCRPEKIGKESSVNPLSCHSLVGDYLTGLQTRFGERLQSVGQQCDQ